MNNIEKFSKAFLHVKSQGGYRSRRAGNTGIGKTLEDAIGVEENNIEAPDLHDFEIKSQRAESNSFVTLFTKAPTYPPGANSRLREEYGSQDAKFEDMKVLHTSVFANRWNTHKAGYAYRMGRDDDNERLSLYIREATSGAIVEDCIYWTYEVLRDVLHSKLKNLAYIQAEVQRDGEDEIFHFTKCTLHYGLSLGNFLAHITSGDIMFDIRIGVYRNPDKPSYGKTHDHGSGFRIRGTRLKSLYEHHKEVK